MARVGSQNGANVRFTETVSTPVANESGQARAQKPQKKLRDFLEGRAVSRSHVQSGSASDRLASIKAPQRRDAPKPLPKTEAVKQQAFMQKIAAEKPPALGMKEFETQVASFVNLPTNKINTLLTQLNQSGGPGVSIDHLRAFRRCMQQSGRMVSAETRQLAKDFAQAFVSLPKNEQGARTNFPFEGVLTAYALDIAQGKF